MKSREKIKSKKVWEMQTIWASKVREFVFCPRSWAYDRHGIMPSPEAEEQKKDRCDQGNRSHREHGEAVCQANIQLRRGALLIKFGLAVVVLGGVVWFFYF